MTLQSKCKGTSKGSHIKRLSNNFGSRLLAWLLLTCLAYGLASLAWTTNLERSCTLKQWPILQSCIDQNTDSTVQVQSLRKRISRNPGDSQAWISLAALSSESGKINGVDHNAMLDMSTQLAADDYRVQRMQAKRAIEHKQWPLAVDWLIRLVQDNSDAPAALALAMLVQEPSALAAMQLHLKPGDDWLEPVFDAMPAAKVPVILAMPLVMNALQQKILSPQLIEKLIRQLKAHGLWLQAYALWTSSLDHPVPLLFNGDFDLGFIDSGFDWVVTPISPSQSGALVRQIALDQRGGVLQIEFTGRPVAVPVIYQNLVLLNTRYVLNGEFSANNLRVNEGLAWTLRCVANDQEIARTLALKDTANQWQPFTVEFEIPPGCGRAVALQLQTFAPYEAATGLRGQITFNNLHVDARP